MDQWTFSLETDSGKWMPMSAIGGLLIGDRMRALKWLQFNSTKYLPQQVLSTLLSITDEQLLVMRSNDDP